MPPSKDSKAKVVDKSLIRHYVNSLSKSEWDKQKERYEEEEPLADSKSWKEFLRLAISREELEGRSADAKAIIREGNQVVSKTQLKPNSLMGFGKRTNPELDLALANLERRAQRWSERRHGHGDARDRGHSHGHEPERRRSHHDRHPRMPAIHEEEVRPNASQGRGYGPAPPQGYVYPPRPPIRPPPDQQSLRGTTMIGSGYSSYLPDSNNQGSYAARSGRDSMADGGSRVGSQGRVSGVSRESTRLSRIAYTDDERRGPEATVACLIGEAVAMRVGVRQALGYLEADWGPKAMVTCLIGEAVAATVGVGQAPEYLEVDMDPEATFAYPTGDSVAVAVRVEQAPGYLEADIRMIRTPDL